MKKNLLLRALFICAMVLVFGVREDHSAEAAVGKNTCIISTCHSSGKPACAREKKLAGLVCSMQAEAADFCVSFIKCGADKRGQCVVTNDKPFKTCKACVTECLGEGAASDAPLSQRISCQRKCVAAATAPPAKVVPVKKTK